MGAVALTQSTRSSVSPHTYRPAWWIPGPHLRTLWGKLVRRPAPVPVHEMRWDTPDGDFIDLLRLDAPGGAPRLILLHGLEGTARSHYVRATLAEMRRRGWGADVLIFRSCGEEPNRTRRFYHSGETTDLAFVIDRVIAEHPESPIFLAGVSLGGNVLLKHLGEQGDRLPRQVRAAAAVSVPYDLERSARRIGQGFSRLYEQVFLRTLRRKATAKLSRFPDLFAGERLDAARTLWEFDDVVTGPVHGFDGATDYYTRSSSIGFLAGIRVSTLLLSAVDDPFLPPDVLDRVRDIAAENPVLEIEFVDRGGHVGFISGSLPWRPFYYAEWRVAEFLGRQLEVHAAAEVAGGGGER